MEQKTFKRNGFIYGPGTAKGFARMRRLGIPQPPFALENKFYNYLKDFFLQLSVKMINEFMDELDVFKRPEQVLDAAPGKKSRAEILKEFHESLERAKKLDKDFEIYRKLHPDQEIITREQVLAAKAHLGTKWELMDPEAAAPEVIAASAPLKETLSGFLEKGQKDVIAKLLQDADADTKRILESFTIDKAELFNRNMEELKKLYLDDSIKRISWEQNALKKAFLQRFTDYINGKDDELDFQDIVKATFDRGDTMARLFTRDQMARFSKAITIAEYQGAGATRVKWATCHDQRVRPTHQALDGKEFDINYLPDELHDFNCRCGLIPVAFK